MFKLCAMSALIIALSVGVTRPAAETRPASVPPDKLKEIDQLFQRPKGNISRSKLAELLALRMQNVIELGTKVEEKYPDAADLHLVRSRMLQAADFLVRQRRDALRRKQLHEIATRILESKGPLKSKVAADYFVTRSKIEAVKGSGRKEKIPKLMEGLAARYADTDSAAAGLLYASILAHQYPHPHLEERFLSALESEHRDQPGVLDFLRQAGRKPDVGKPFEAELSRLDGKKLDLPDDLIGKVVLVDFWATWCGPCVVSLPHLKEVYSKYNEKGLEIVGISLDESRGKVAKFVRDNSLTWVHTYTGKGWADPTARRYGVTAIPSMWLIGRDGNVITDNARGRLEQLIPQAIRQPVPGTGGK